VPASYLNQGHVAIAASGGNNDAHLFAESRTLRIRHFNGLDFIQ
jgi:hypothetical protein